MGIESTRPVLLSCDYCGRGAKAGRGIHGDPYHYDDSCQRLWRVQTFSGQIWVCDECKEKIDAVRAGHGSGGHG